MTVAPMTTTSASTAAGQTTSAAPSSTPAINADFNMFLKMLTTQMQNQDPLDPMQSSDFAVQLATFSGVEQQTKTNELLTGLAGQLGTQGIAQLSGWIGMEVRSAAPTAYDGTPVTLVPAPEASADKTFLVVQNAAGAEIARSEIPVSSAPIQWDGLDSSGAQLPPGTYSFQLENYSGGTLVGTDPVESYSRVTEAQSGATGPVLVLQGGATVPAAQVTAIRPAD